MATIVLSVVGGLIAGPLGAAIGAYAGQRVDARLLGPKGRSGPRLADLSVQTSSYGNPLPKLFGRSRVSGTVIWATDLRETRKKVSAGKGQPKQTVYSYSASLAVALSAREVIRVERIWADGKLLRGAAGDFKVPTGFRLHTGSEAQTADPLIASAEGQAPAYRGIAYAVFEDLQLGDFGNRIPTLSFEVVADEGETGFGEMLAELTTSTIQTTAPTRLGGVAVNSDSLRGVAEAFEPAVILLAMPSGSALALSEVPLAGPDIDPLDLGAHAAGQSAEAPVLRIERQIGRAVPRHLNLVYRDPDRDYQPSLQTARAATGAARELQVELPATLTAPAAAALAGQALGQLRDGQGKAQFSLPWRYLGLHPGMSVALPGDAGEWLLEQVALEKMVVRITARPHRRAAIALGGQDPGRSLSEPDALHGPTVLHLIDAPPLEGAVSAPRLLVAASGTSPGWRRAALSFSLDNGLTWEEAGPSATPAVMGRAASLLPIGPSTLLDERSHVDVDMLHGEMVLTDTDTDGLLAGRNLAMLGGELIQFGSATQLSPNRFRLSRLLRGRRGTEAAMASHELAEPFTLIEAESLTAIPVPTLGMAMLVMAIGVGDNTAEIASQTVANGGVRPLSPVMLAARPDGAGGYALTWTRRSREGWAWSDGVDAPLGEEAEQYRVEFRAGDLVVRSVTVPASGLAYSQADLLADGGGPVRVSVSQLGRFAASPPASLILHS